MTNYVSLQDCCEIINGYAFKSEHYVPQGIRIIRIANVQRGYIADESPCFYSSDDPNASIRYKLFENDLLISLTGNVGRVGLLPHSLLPAALNQRVVCLRLRPESPVTKEFIFCCLNREEFENDCILNSTGVAQKNLSSKWLKAYKIPVPTPLQQQQICKSISAIDKLHNALNRKLSHFDCLVKSRFIEMFGDPGLNSENYPIVRLSEIAEYHGGLTYSPSDVAEEGVIVLRSNNIQNGRIDLSDVVKVTCPIREKYYVRSKDILICSRNGSARLVGKAALIDKASTPMAFGAFMMIIRSSYYPYLLPLLSMRAFRSQLSFGTATINQITSRMLNSVRIPCPPTELVNEFEGFVTKVDKLRFDVQQQIEKLETLKKSLMQEYFG